MKVLDGLFEPFYSSVVEEVGVPEWGVGSIGLESLLPFLVGLFAAVEEV